MLNLRDFSYLNLLKPECSQVPPDVAINVQDVQGNPLGKLQTQILSARFGYQYQTFKINLYYTQKFWSQGGYIIRDCFCFFFYLIDLAIK